MEHSILLNRVLSISLKIYILLLRRRFGMYSRASLWYWRKSDETPCSWLSSDFRPRSVSSSVFRVIRFKLNICSFRPVREHTYRLSFGYRFQLLCNCAHSLVSSSPTRRASRPVEGYTTRAMPSYVYDLRPWLMRWIHAFRFVEYIFEVGKILRP